MDAHIVVRGTGQAAALPDRAVVRVEVDGEGGSRDDAYREAAKAALDAEMQRSQQKQKRKK